MTHLRSGPAPLNDFQMCYQLHGDGTPLILPHGGMGNAGHRGNQIPVLSGQYRVIAAES